MPTYEYRCTKGHPFEQIQKMADKPVAKCPKCGARASRVISGGQGLIFKGSGFYITDYGKDGKGARKDPDGATKAEAKTEAKTEAKSEAKSTDTAVAKPESKADAKAGGATKPAKPDAS